MIIGEVDVNKFNDGLKVEVCEFAEGLGVMIKNLGTDEVLLCLDGIELKPLAELLIKANELINSN